MKTQDQPIGDDDLQSLIDGRLAPERRAAVDAYLAAHPEHAADVAADMEIMAQLRARLAVKAQEPVPPRLRVANIVAERQRVRTRRFRSLAAAAALLIVGGATGWFANGILRPHPAPVAVAATQDAILAYRTYVVEKLHPVEVRAQEEAHLVQWLSRRLGKPLSAPDLTAQGYALMGGRLLPASSDGPAAMFMYADEAGNRLTLYARTDGSDRSTGFRFDRQDDVSAFSWTDRDLAYVVAGKVGRPQLLGVAEAVYHQLTSKDGDRL